MHNRVTEQQKVHTPLPDKLFFKIGEVSKILGVEPYVLRYWETEFPFLKPRKSKSGQRIYIRKDVETLLVIRRLLYQERYTIEGVRKRLGRNYIRAVEPKPEPESKTPAKKDPAALIEYTRKRLREILNQLS